MTFADKVIDFHFKLKATFKLPAKIEILNPFAAEETKEVFKAFYQKFYADAKPRIYLFGINPGRFGAGVTGVSFTDPIRLEKECGIQNHFKKLPELSSVFIYEVIHAYGGVKSFYKDVYVNAVCPLGFTKDGINLNYYDDKELYKRIKPFIIDSLWKQASFGMHSSTMICVGEGSNFKCLSEINKEQKIFENIIPLPHPRWVMQYRRKMMGEYVKRYVEVINSLAEKKLVKY
jgi:hypothetical protein